MTNKEIAQTFQLLANLMELHDGDPFRIRSYQFVYQNIKNLDLPLSDLPASEMANIKGIGKSIASQITSILQTGELPALQQLIEITPPGILELLKIKGFGPKKIKQLWSELSIETPGELLYAIQENRLLSLKGFGQKSQDELHKQVLFLLAHQNLILFPDLMKEADEFLTAFKAFYPAITIELTGDLKRKLPYSGNIEFIIDGFPLDIDFTPISDFLVIESNTNQVDGSWKSHFKIKLYFSEKEKFANKLMVYTGNTLFIESLPFNLVAPESPDLLNEKEVFTFLNSGFIPPELREYAFSEVSDGNLLENLIQITDIKGVVHTHSKYSDGSNSIEEMANAAKNEGYSYLVMTDHSQAAFYANGLKWENIQQQHLEIDTLNKKKDDFRILKGIECDILSSGDLDYDEDILRTFDVVIASVHSVLKMNEERAMSRLIKAIENPFTHILGHPTGRLLLTRPGYPLDMEKIIDACSANKVSIELNGNPRRLDLDWQWIPYAMNKEVQISINPDAHSIKGIMDIHHGVNMARKGKLLKKYCLNALDVNSFLTALKK